MFNSLKKDVEVGIQRIKWFASLLSERIRVEITVFKLLYKSEELKKRREELLKKIGEEAYETRGKGKNIYANREVTEAIRELEAIDPEIQETIEKVSDISKIVA